MERRGEDRWGGRGKRKVARTHPIFTPLFAAVDCSKEYVFLADFFDVLGPAAVCHFTKRGLGSKFGQM